MFWRKKSYFDNSASDIKNRLKQHFQVGYIASIEQLFLMLNAATPTLFNRFDKRGDRHKVMSSYKPHLQQCCSVANVILEFHMLERWSSYRNGILFLHIALVAKSRASNGHNKLHPFKPLNISWCIPVDMWAHMILNDMNKECTRRAIKRFLSDYKVYSSYKAYSSSQLSISYMFISSLW